MAEDKEDKTIVEGAEGEQEEGSKKKGSNKLILFGGIGVGAIAIGIALTLFVVKPMMSSSDADAKASDGQHTEEVTEDSHAEVEEEEEDSHGGGSHGEDDGSPGNIYTVQDIVINPAGTSGSRFLSISFAFELKSKSHKRKFEKKEAAIRDALITILSSKTVAQLTDPKQKEITRYQIKKRLEKLLKLKELAGVYYTDFVLQ